MEPEPRQIRIPRGRAWEETWAFADDADDRADLTGCTGTLQFYPSTGVEPLVSATFTLSDAGEGEVTWSLTEEQVAELDGERTGHWLMLLTDTQDTVHEARGTLWMEDAP
jgi:hypothetical protein